jgi:hypothetical protein
MSTETTTKIDIADHWTNYKPGTGPLYSAGLRCTNDPDVGYSRAQVEGTLAQFREAIVNLEALRSEAKGPDLRSLNAVILRLGAAADRIDPEVRAALDRARMERQAARAAERFEAQLAELVTWFVSFGGDVDRTAFNEACSRLLGLANEAKQYRIRIPLVVAKAEGLFKLDAACALMGEQLPDALLTVDCAAVDAFLDAGRLR